MAIFFRLLRRDDVHSHYGSTYIVPKRWGLVQGDPTPELSPDCASAEELNARIDEMMMDLKRLKKEGRKHFEVLRVKKTEEVRNRRLLTDDGLI